jgi:hypothetical protein
LVSVRRSDEKQNDIWLLSPSSKKCRQLTNTAANEYSPQLEPSGEFYSVVRQIEGEPIDQQVYQFPTQGGSYSSLTPNARDVGYYAWLRPDELALYRLEGESNRLMADDLTSQKMKKITNAIGRTLVADGNRGLYYIHKFSDTYWYIKKYDETSTVIEVIAETPSKSEDFALAPDGTFFIGQGQKLMYLSNADQNTWKECGDLSIYGIQHISRLAVSHDGKQLALVSTKD